MRLTLIPAALLCLSLGCESANENDIPARDNSATNTRDAATDTLTPFDQSNEQSDIDLVAKLRSSVLEIEDLSTDGRNIKIITNDGNVHLRGPVETQAESDAIEKVVVDIAGAANVTNQLEVKTE